MPLDRGFQVLPPSSVCSMVPLTPTAQPNCDVAKVKEYKAASVTPGRRVACCSCGTNHHLHEKGEAGCANWGGACCRIAKYVTAASDARDNANTAIFHFPIETDGNRPTDEPPLVFGAERTVDRDGSCIVTRPAGYTLVYLSRTLILVAA